jgi:hypothetical protein
MILPPELLAFADVEDRDRVILFLQKLPVSMRMRKEMYVAWTQYVGAALTEEAIQILLGPAAETTRG